MDAEESATGEQQLEMETMDMWFLSHLAFDDKSTPLRSPAGVTPWKEFQFGCYSKYQFVRLD